MHNSGNAESTGGHNLILRGCERTGPGFRVNRFRAEGTGQLPEAIGDDVVPDERSAGHVRLVGCDTAAGGISSNP